VTRASDGLLLGTITNLDHGVRLPIDRIDEQGTNVRLEVRAIGGIFQGVLAGDGNRITGTWTQGAPPTALEFRRGSVSEASRAEPKPAESGDPFGVPVEMKVPVAPTPFRSGSQSTGCSRAQTGTRSMGIRRRTPRIAPTGRNCWPWLMVPWFS
jgi:hypothetical protein